MFAGLDQLANDTLLRVMGEEALLRPQVRKGYVAASTDGDRPAIRVVGIMIRRPKTDTLLPDKATGGRMSHSYLGGTVEFWIPAVPEALLPGEVREGDILEITGRSLRFSVVMAQRGLHDDLRLILASQEQS